ncbi:purple acid phosphatase family protein [Sphingobacterium sp. SGR-19]|uniref:purple acid phosphatase family protein n=1 Tax=Sphingobacterium sp. SGR-19 TaxID=2710886 RepID=UPI0013EDF017|nr:metallophosphoesterase family protein [Sphingobacterium sp. SGR-19]NGM64108.1 metallophosphoesterase family protein [Sphingobacterium sp. SGR-19]
MNYTFKLIGLIVMCQQMVSASERPSFVVKPYLQWSTQNEMTVKWETSTPMRGFVEYGKATFNAESPVLSQKAEGKADVSLQTATLTGLEAETEYFYRAVSISAAGDTLRSRIYPFKTAVKDDSPFAFTVFSDTQGVPNPTVWGQVAKIAERERPNFAIHSGDQVDNGHDRSNWIGQFFPQGESFMNKYAVFAVPGNHENDAPNYHNYLGHPEGLRCYSFVYGNTEFFMFDTNQDVSEGSEIYKKLEADLAKSTAKWKIVAHHHPIYSSDNDDYGNTRVAKSTLGSPKLKHLAPLYEKYDVDIVFYGHVHTYERTWPLRDNKVDLENGTIYMTMGGGGGGLETPSFWRSWFTNKLFLDHHFGYVRIVNGELHFQAIDLNGNILDQFILKK